MKYMRLVIIVLCSALASLALSEDKIAVIDMQAGNVCLKLCTEYGQGGFRKRRLCGFESKAESSAADLQSMAKEAETKRLTWYRGGR